MAARGSFQMTIANCAAECAVGAYSYMGLSWGSRCYCGNDPPGAAGADGTEHPKEDSDSSCDRSCGGDPMFNCGGPYKLSAYRIEDPARITSPDCDWFQPIHNYDGKCEWLRLCLGTPPVASFLCLWLRFHGALCPLKAAARPSDGGPEMDYLGCFKDTDRNRFYREPRRVDRSEAGYSSVDGWSGPPRAPRLNSADSTEQISDLFSGGTTTVAGREAWAAAVGGRSFADGTLVEPMHIELCATLCMGAGYLFMAIYDGTECSCSNDSPEEAGAEPDDEAGCNDACPGDFRQICGDVTESRKTASFLQCAALWAAVSERFDGSHCN